MGGGGLGIVGLGFGGWGIRISQNFFFLPHVTQTYYIDST